MSLVKANLPVQIEYISQIKYFKLLKDRVRKQLDINEHIYVQTFLMIHML